MNNFNFSIRIPSTNGFIGRKCNNTSCNKYFKISEKNISEKKYCPYCGSSFEIIELTTDEQMDYVNKTAKEEITSIVHHKLDKMFERAISKNIGRNIGPISISIKFKPSKYRKKNFQVTEKDVDSEIVCGKCGAVFQVYGLFGYCPVCRYDNILIYDVNIELIIKELDESSLKEKHLRHAYNDLVSTFEDFCSKKNEKFADKVNFQNLDTTESFFQKHHKKALFDNLSSGEIKTIRKVFQKRHVNIHNKGIIDTKYITVFSEETNLLGHKVQLSKKEFLEGTKILRKILLNIL